MSRNIIERRGTYFQRTEGDGTAPKAFERRVQFILIRNGLPRIDDWEQQVGAVAARVNHARWIADCPDNACRGAEFVDPDWPVFVCCSCGVGPYVVAFPPSPAAIETELLKRADDRTRNWVPGDTLDDLRREREEVT